MKHRITGVDKGSPAWKAGVRDGMFLLELNGEPVEDIIDYEMLSAQTEFTLRAEDTRGTVCCFCIRKELYEPLGLSFESSLMSPVRTCKNHCLFCFIDQMPRGVRDTLHFKDDDWRLSLIMGNYVTLTNVSDDEFERMIKRRVSPLYVSVHATDPEVRCAMMRNPTAGTLMRRLERLRDEGLKFHAQIVLCPGINDGEVLERSLEALYALRPCAQTVAVVPVGLTRYREKLAPLRNLTPEEAARAIDMAEAVSRRAREETGEGFAYASDEMYIAAGREVPCYESYDGFSQIENGVGLLRRFEFGFNEALADMQPLYEKKRVLAATGASAFSFLKPLMDKLAAYNIEVELCGIRNDYFGAGVTVAGLVTAGDIAAQLKGKTGADALVIPDDMLRERDDVFLDGHNVRWLSDELGIRVMPLCAADGEDFIYGLFDGLRKDEEKND